MHIREVTSNEYICFVKLSHLMYLNFLFLDLLFFIFEGKCVTVYGNINGRMAPLGETLQNVAGRSLEDHEAHI